MTETRTFSRRAALASAVAIPLAAVGSVVLDDYDDLLDDTIECPTRPGSGCVEDSPAALHFDRIVEDDGEPE